MVHRLRHSSLFLLLCAAGILTILALALHAGLHPVTASSATATRSSLVKSLKLTDLCIFTEARYTRNPAMADNHAPFQEHPAALEHFPSGSLLLPDRKLRNR
jgi:hypothetical protein